MKRTTLYVVLGVVLIAVIGGGVWWTQSARQREMETRSAIVERGPMLMIVSASGNVDPHSRVDLNFETPGRVAEVLVETGDTVESGDLLARLDTGQLELQVQQAQAALDLAEAQLAQLRSGPRAEDVASAQANLDAAQSQVNAAAANRDQVEGGASEAEISAAESQVASARLQYEIAQDTYDQVRDSDAGETEEERAHYDLYVAKKALDAAQINLDELLAGADSDAVRASRANVWRAAAQRDAAQSQLDLLLAGATKEQIADTEAQVEQARVSLKQAQLSLERAALRAPFDGIVSKVDIEIGEMTSGGRSVVTLLDASSFYVTIGVDEMDVGRLTNGQEALVTLDALPEAEIPGTIERIAPVATLEGGVVYYDVIIELSATDAPVRADMTANAAIQVEKFTDVLKIPTWVVRIDQDTGQPYVNRRVGEDIERVDVALGVRYEGFVQVLDALSEGQEVIWVADSTHFGSERE